MIRIARTVGVLSHSPSLSPSPSPSLSSSSPFTSLSPPPSSTSPSSFNLFRRSFGGSTSPPHHEHSTYIPGCLLKSTSVVATHAKGVWVTAANGDRYLDFTSGIGVTNLGHSHPRVVDAMKRQIDRGIHLQQNVVTSDVLIDLVPKFKGILPPRMKEGYQMLFSSSGAECIENAVKLAKQATRRQTIIVFNGGFHGRTIATGALTTAKTYYRAYNQPSMSGVHVVPYPYCYRCPVSVKSSGQYGFSNCCELPMDSLHKMIKQETAADEVAAVLVEPMLGEGGYVLPPSSFFTSLRKFCNDTGALLIFDEVQSGFGRTGSYLACTHPHINCEPDIIAVAKGLGNGVPVSAIISRTDVWKSIRPGSVGGTYSGNTLCLAAANAVMDVLLDPKERIMENVDKRGKQLEQHLHRLSKKFPIGDIRGIGLMRSAEFAPSVPAGTANRIVEECEKEKLFVINAGIYETLRFIPPLTTTEQEMEEGIRRLERAMEKAFQKK